MSAPPPYQPQPYPQNYGGPGYNYGPQQMPPQQPYYPSQGYPQPQPGYGYGPAPQMQPMQPSRQSGGMDSGKCCLWALLACCCGCCLAECCD